MVEWQTTFCSYILFGILLRCSNASEEPIGMDKSSKSRLAFLQRKILLRPTSIRSRTRNESRTRC